MIDCANKGDDAGDHDAESPPIPSRLSVNLHRSCQSFAGRENQAIPHNAGNCYDNRFAT